MQSPNPRLEEIKRLENADAIKTTKTYAGLAKFTFDKDSMQFRPSIVPRIFFLMVGCILVTPFGFSLANILKDVTGSDVARFPMAGLPGLVVVILGIRHFRAQKNVGILIDKSGLTLDNDLYPWSDVYETAMLEKYRSLYLTVVLKENSAYRLYRLTNFRAFDLFFPATVAKYIEHFKPPAPPPPTTSN